jgi:hypothetical protein
MGMTIRRIRNAACAALVLALASGCVGFETPRHDARFGSAPTNYDSAVKRYLLSNLDYPEVTRFKISKPRKAYMNEGILLGGDIIWAGYVVDVHVQSVDRGFRRSDRYVVRLHNDEVIEVHSATDLPVLHEL